MHLFGKLYHLAGNNDNTIRSLVKSSSFMKTSNKSQIKPYFRLQAAKGNTLILINVNDFINICQYHLLLFRKYTESF